MDNDEVLSSDVGDVYFDSNALVDGDGSENNPYKNLNSNSLQNCNIAHLKQVNIIFQMKSIFREILNLLVKIQITRL